MATPQEIIADQAGQITDLRQALANSQAQEANAISVMISMIEKKDDPENWMILGPGQARRKSEEEIAQQAVKNSDLARRLNEAEKKLDCARRSSDETIDSISELNGQQFGEIGRLTTERDAARAELEELRKSIAPKVDPVPVPILATFVDIPSSSDPGMNLQTSVETPADALEREKIERDSLRRKGNTAIKV